MTKAPSAEERLRTVVRWLAFVEAHAPLKEAAAVLAALQKATRDEVRRDCITRKTGPVRRPNHG